MYALWSVAKGRAVPYFCLQKLGFLPFSVLIFILRNAGFSLCQNKNVCQNKNEKRECMNQRALFIGLAVPWHYVHL